jgi:predicted dehydrogenase
MEGYKKVKVAVIGCGAISDIYFQNMTKHFEILDVVACCDLNQELAQQAAEKYGIKVMSLEEIISDQEIEIVVNLTNPAAHYNIIKKLLLSGKNVYTEKVLTVNVEEAKELVDLAKENNKLLCSAPDTFLGAAVQTARFVIDSQIIGKVTSCVAVLQRDAELLAEKFPYTTKLGGGIGIDVGIYYTTALINLLGPAVDVCGMSGIIDPQKKHYFVKNSNFGQEYTQEAETYLIGTVRFADGCIGSLHFNSRSIRTEKPFVAFYGTEGILYLPDPNFFGGEVKVVMKGQIDPIVFPHTHAYDGNDRGLGVAEMAWSLRKGKVPRTNGDMAYHALEILTGIIESCETESFYKMKSTFVKSEILPRGFLGESYAMSQPEASLS